MKIAYGETFISRTQVLDLFIRYTLESTDKVGKSIHVDGRKTIHDMCDEVEIGYSLVHASEIR